MALPYPCRNLRVNLKQQTPEQLTINTAEINLQLQNAEAGLLPQQNSTGILPQKNQPTVLPKKFKRFKMRLILVMQ